MSEWNKKVLTTVDRVVDVATTKVVAPAHKSARAIVYGIVIAFLAFIALLFLVIAAFRATDLAVPTYGVYLVFGVLFLGIGLVLWAKK